MKTDTRDGLLARLRKRPMTTSELAIELRITRRAVNYALVALRASGHNVVVADWGCDDTGLPRRLMVLGEPGQKDAPRLRNSSAAKPPARPREVTPDGFPKRGPVQVVVQRDPLTAALFGPAGAP